MKIKIIIPTLLLLLALLLGACSDATVDAGPTLTPNEVQGKRLFAIHCAACHAISKETVIVGPGLGGIREVGATRIKGLDAAGYIELSILNPNAVLIEGFDDLMPTTFGKQLTTDELNAIVAYVLTLD